MGSKNQLVNSRISRLHHGIDILQELEILFGKERKTKFSNFLIASKIHSLQSILESEFGETVADAKEARGLCRKYRAKIEELKEKRPKEKKDKSCYRRQFARY